MLMGMCFHAGSAILALVLAAAGARAGYITVGMGEARQCNTSLVEWYGDDGPYHLLLTPTQFVSHGYNVWIPSIPNGTKSYELPISQPAGLQYMVTVWGASGIEYAGTTDVLTVLPPLGDDKSCLLNNDAINNLYTFAFNITDASRLPPQCSTMNMSWPTSLESTITAGTRRSLPGGEDMAEVTSQLPVSLVRRERPEGEEYERDPDDLDAGAETVNLAASLITSDGTSSSNKTTGNTTFPPTMFGIIPLGNSFSIPITYPRDSKYSIGLPDSSLSDEPTTWTSKGVTHLNWTVSLTKGTRFILVAGIGSAEQWASGGSSEMMTVGQGSFSCLNLNNGAKPKPSVTASASTGRLNIPTGTSTSTPSDKPKERAVGVLGIVLASVFSALGTLALATCLYCCCRVRRHRTAARKNGLPKPSLVSLATFGRLESKRGAYIPGNRAERDGDGNETQLDLIDDDSQRSRPTSTWRREMHSPSQSPANSRPGTEFGSPVDMAEPYAYDLPFAPYMPKATAPSPSTPSQSHPRGGSSDYPYGYTHVSGPAGPPTPSPVMPSQAAARDSLERGGVEVPPPALDGSQPLSPAWAPAQPSRPLPNRPLVLHDGGEDAEDITNLKRDTLAILPPRAGPSRRRRTDDDIVVHRDAGRVRVELPPRYDDLDWDMELPPPQRANTVPAIPSPPPPPQSPVGRGSPSPLNPSPSSPLNPASPSPRRSPSNPSYDERERPRSFAHSFASPTPVSHTRPLTYASSGSGGQAGESLYDSPSASPVVGDEDYGRPPSLASMSRARSGSPSHSLRSPSLPPGAAPPRPPPSPGSQASPRRSPQPSPNTPPPSRLSLGGS